MKFERGRVYFDTIGNRRVEYCYKETDGLVMVCEPGQPDSARCVVSVGRLRNLTWVELTDQELEDIVLGRFSDKRDDNSKLMALDEIKRRSHGEGYDKGRSYKPDDVMLEKLLNACGFVRAGSKNNG